MRNPVVYIRRRTDMPPTWFDIVERKCARFESKIHPLGVDLKFLEWMQNNGCVLIDADFITHEMIQQN